MKLLRKLQPDVLKPFFVLVGTAMLMLKVALAAFRGR
jgi:hypothetical protein